MSADDKLDAIIIGAGPAGLACAYLLANAGKSVVVLERASAAGEKNLTGGRMYSHALESLEKGLCAEAAQAGALERPVTHEQIMFMSSEMATVVDFTDQKFLSANVHQGVQSWTVLHAHFINWFADKVEQAGAVMGYGVRVDKLIEQDGVVTGVYAGGDELFADVVVAADGVNSLIVSSAGLNSHVNAHSVGLGIKEVIELPAEIINERFLTGPNGGAARVILGCTAGIPGGGALYTNRNSISLACVFNPAEAVKQNKPLPEIFQEFRTHPSIASLVEGGKTIEYGAHLVMENGWRNVLDVPYKKGMLIVGEAAGYVINTGLIIRGIDLAILSGSAAARTILFSSDSIDLGLRYKAELENCGLDPAMRATAKWPDLMASPQLFTSYPTLVNGILNQFFTVDSSAESLKRRIIKTYKNSGATITAILRDTWRTYKAL